jgi:hypothetical protein
MNKESIFPELARLGSHIMGRAPEATAATEGAVRGAMGQLQNGAKRVLNTPIPGTPEVIPAGIRWHLRKGVDKVIENPALALGTVTPVPFGGPLLMGAQRAVESGINRLVPPKLAFAVSQYSGALNPVIESGASYLPQRKVPRLDVAVDKGNLLKEKDSDALPEGIAMQPWDSFKRSKYAFMDESNPYLRKAVIGALGGALVGGLGGVGHEAIWKTPMKPMSIHTEAQDNAGVDTRYEGADVGSLKPIPEGSSPIGSKHYTSPRELAVGRLASTQNAGKKVKPPPGVREIVESGRHRTVTVDRPELDVAGRISPLSFHHDRRAMSREQAIEFAQREARTPGKYAMPTEKMAEFVEGLLKEAIPGLTPQSRLEQSARIGAPKATPPPGPSIADIAKPKGSAFGTAIAGANKGTIGGTSVGGIGNMKSLPSL